MTLCFAINSLEHILGWTSMIRGIAIPGVQVHIIQEAEVTQEAGVLDEAIAARAEVYLLGVNTLVALCLSHPQGLFPLLALFQGTFSFHIKVYIYFLCFRNYHVFMYVLKMGFKTVLFRVLIAYEQALFEFSARCSLVAIVLLRIPVFLQLSIIPSLVVFLCLFDRDSA